MERNREPGMNPLGDVTFECPACGQRLEAPQDMAGERIDCPACQAVIHVPSALPQSRVPSKAPAPVGCAACGAPIPEGERSCSRCGTTRGADPAYSRRAISTSAKPTMDRSLLWGSLVVVLVCVAAGIWIWMHRADLHRTPESPSSTPDQPVVGTAAAKPPLVKPIRLRRFSETEHYMELQQKADAIAAALAAALQNEDSAYRAICRRSEAVRLLLGLLAEAEGAVLGTQVSSVVAAVHSAAEADLGSEESAIRAIYKNDEGALLMLGVWCQALSGRDSDPMATFTRAAGRVDDMLRQEDSAYRADTAVLAGMVAVLSSLAEAYVGGGRCAGILSALQSTTRFDDSTLRSSTAHAKACMEILLILVARTDASRAEVIAAEVRAATLLDDSTFRVHGEYKQGMFEAVRFLIAHPPSMR